MFSKHSATSALRFFSLIGSLSLALTSLAGEVLQEPPATVNKDAKYLFFLHGNIVEEKGVASARSKEFGFYEYRKILNTLARHDLTVISEVRSDDTKIKPYAKKIAQQVNDLMKKGVPPGNITVAGFSKGGKITLVTASNLANAQVNYVVLAGCLRNASEFIKKFNLNLTGRVLSLVDHRDDTFASCEAMFKHSSGALEHQEIILKTGRGHGVFYTPDDRWVLPIVDWIK